jgi:hypothetical protein
VTVARGLNISARHSPDSEPLGICLGQSQCITDSVLVVLNLISWIDALARRAFAMNRIVTIDVTAATVTDGVVTKTSISIVLVTVRIRFCHPIRTID